MDSIWVFELGGTRLFTIASKSGAGCALLQVVSQEEFDHEFANELQLVSEMANSQKQKNRIFFFQLMTVFLGFRLCILADVKWVSVPFDETFTRYR